MTRLILSAIAGFALAILLTTCNKSPTEPTKEPEPIGDLLQGFEPCALGKDNNLPTCETFRERFQTDSISLFITSQKPGSTRCCTTEFEILDGVMTPVGEDCDNFDANKCPKGWWKDR